MVKVLGTALLALALVGCAAPADRAWWRELAGLPAVPGQFRFDWQIAGDPSLAPLQVFDDGSQTWLQYPVDQPAPAVFERAASGDRLLRPQRKGDFLVLPGVPQRLVMRGGHLQAEVWRAQEEGVSPPKPVVESPLSSAVPLVAGGVTSSAPNALAAEAAPVVPMAREIVSALPPAVPSVAFMPSPPAPPPLPPVVPPAPRPISPAVAKKVVTRSSTSIGMPSAPYEATPTDGNIRRALGRWAKVSGWTFEAEHWAVDVDIPLAGSAAFGPDFVPAVRELLAATELGDRPLQPCFYANRVLRVVPFAQRCDRTQIAGAAS